MYIYICIHKVKTHGVNMIEGSSSAIDKDNGYMEQRLQAISFTLYTLFEMERVWGQGVEKVYVYVYTYTYMYINIYMYL
jgi:hypothetical protein